MSDEDDFEERERHLRRGQREAFELSIRDAKALSDYTGIIMRATFAILVTAFFKREADAATGSFWWAFFMYCGGLSLLLALLLTNSIVNVTGLWVMENVLPQAKGASWLVPPKMLIVLVTVGSVLAGLCVLAWQFATNGSIASNG